MGSGMEYRPSWRVYTNFNTGAEVDCAHGRFPLLSGEVVVLPCWQAFRGVLHNPVDHAWIQFTTPQWPSAIAKKYFLKPLRLGPEAMIHAPAMAALRMLRAEKADDPHRPLATRHMASLISTAYGVLCHYLNTFEEPSLHYLDTLQPVVDYIDNHIANDLRIETLAHSFGWSPGYLSRLFAKELGISAGQYIREARITVAAELLLQPDLSLEQIASRCGFAHRHHFTRVFSQVMGMPPAAYRKQQLVVAADS